MTTAEKKNSSVIPMPKDHKEFHRIKYSLKMALRIINGKFKKFTVMQYGTSGFNLEDDNDMTAVECWHYSEQPDMQIEQDLNFPFAQGYQDVATGSILKNVNDIKLQEPIVFYVFRTMVGRSLVVSKRNLKDDDS